MALSSELASMNFDNLVGGPLVAAVNAQAQASIAAAQFITDMALDDDDNVRTITMKVKKKDEEGNVSTVDVEVPLLTILQVPNLRIEEYNYDFNAKINSVDTRNTRTDFGITGSLKVRFPRVRLNVSASYKRQIKTGHTITRDYQMGIKIKAVSDQLPGGTERLLNILEANIAG